MPRAHPAPVQLSPATRVRLAWTTLALALLWLAHLLASVLLPFLVALTLAYGLQPTVERLRRWRVPRPLGAALAILLATLALLAVGALIAAVLGGTLPQLKARVPALLATLNTWLNDWGGRLGMSARIDTASLEGLMQRALSGDPQRWAAQLLNSARSGGGVLVSLVANLVLVPVLTYYLLLDWSNLLQRTWSLVPLPRRDALRGLLAECDVMLGRYVRGQAAVMLILAAYYAIGLALAGFDLALPIGVFTGLAVCVPFVGFGFGLVLALLAGALQFQSWYALWAVAVVYGIGQVLESAWLTPRLLGHHIGLHPLLVIFLLLAGGDLFGFVGVLLALPAGALLQVLARHVLAWYRGSAMFRDER